MRMLRRLALVGLLIWTGCTDDGQEPLLPQEGVEAVVVEPDSVELAVGGSRALAVKVYGRDGQVLSGRTVAWSMDVGTVVALDAAGLVTALAEGTVTLTAASEGKSGRAIVTVRAESETEPPPPPAVASLAINPASILLRAGDTLQLAAATYDSTGAVLGGRVVSWSAQPSSVVTIDGRGLVRAVADGTGVVTATSEGVSVEAAVTVATPLPVSSVTLRPAFVVAYAGQTMSLTATMRDENDRLLQGRTVTWSTSDARVATVDAAGTVTAAGGGDALITASSGGASATTLIHVRTTSSYHVAYDRADRAFLWMNLATGVASPTMMHAENVRASDPHASPDRSGFAYVIQSGDTEPRVAFQAWNGITMRQLALGDQPSFAPDGQRIAFRSRMGGRNDIWVIHADGTTAPVNLTANLPDGTESETPAWSPTGDRIVFAAGNTARKHLWVMNANGTGQKQLTASLYYDSEPSWYGGTIVFTRRNATGSDLWRLNPGNTADPVRLTHLGAARTAAWSPDGRWIAFVLHASDNGVGDLMVMRASGGDIRPLSLRSDGPDGGGLNPTWTIHF